MREAILFAAVGWSIAFGLFFVIVTAPGCQRGAADLASVGYVDR